MLPQSITMLSKEQPPTGNGADRSISFIKNKLFIKEDVAR